MFQLIMEITHFHLFKNWESLRGNNYDCFCKQVLFVVLVCEPGWSLGSPEFIKCARTTRADEGTSLLGTAC